MSGMGPGCQATSAKLTLRSALTATGLLAALACQRSDPKVPEHFSTSATPVITDAATGATAPGTTAVVTGEVRPQPPVALPDGDAWLIALARVEEVRGSAGMIATPPELQHYEDRRRFLAVQMADSREENYRLPHDQGELAQMLRRGEVVELPQMTEDYLLYEVGTDAREDALAHFDRESGKDVPLFASEGEYEAEDARLAAEAEGRGAAAEKAREKRHLLDQFYGDPARAQELFREHAAITSLAADFGGQSYDLTVPQDRARFQVRLLSVVRPEARDMIAKLGLAYRQQFDRHLPITSLIRTERYQRRLARGNPNATHVDIPPHATGMAFDISYKFMAADEQNFVMQQVAELEREGRAEALRERRNHLHIYALADGRPAERIVAGFLADVEAAHPGSRPGARIEKARKGKGAKSTVRRASQKRSAKAAKIRPRTRRAR